MKENDFQLASKILNKIRLLEIEMSELDTVRDRLKECSKGGFDNKDYIKRLVYTLTKSSAKIDALSKIVDVVIERYENEIAEYKKKFEEL